ncbi:MAG: hypothetical protein ACE5HU_09100 [Acidobacteriota bacterium]
MSRRIAPGIAVLVVLLAGLSPCLAGTSPTACPMAGCEKPSVDAAGMTCCCHEPRPASVEPGPAPARCTPPAEEILPCGADLLGGGGLDAAWCGDSLEPQTAVPLYLLHSSLLR